jgi:glycosyltransferase involved in cell wall biosynthesis
MLNRKIKILQLSSVFVDRGVERIILWLFQYLPQDRFAVHIAALRNHVPLADRLREKGTEIVDVIGMRNTLDLFALFRFYKYIKKLQPDVVHIHHFRTAVLCRPLLKLAKVPVVIYSVHNRWGSKIHFALDRWTTRFGNVTVPFSLAVKRFLLEEEKLNPARVREPIYIGIDVEKFRREYPVEIANLKKELNLTSGEKVLGFVGALSPQKGLVFLIDAVEKLLARFPNIKCLLIGEGEQEPALKAKIQQKQLDANFVFPGQRYDIPALLKLMDVFVLPSLWEGLPQVVLEAMAARTPVVATDVCGTPEIIENGQNGLLVPPENADLLAEAITKILGDATLRQQLVENASQTINAKFQVSQMVANFAALYEQLLKDSNGK